MIKEPGISALRLAWSRQSFHVDNMAATPAGLPMRPLAHTLRDTLAWWRDQPGERRASPRSWIESEPEARAIARLKG